MDKVTATVSYCWFTYLPKNNFSFGAYSQRQDLRQLPKHPLTLKLNNYRIVLQQHVLLMNAIRRLFNAFLKYALIFCVFFKHFLSNNSTHLKNKRAAQLELHLQFLRHGLSNAHFCVQIFGTPFGGQNFWKRCWPPSHLLKVNATCHHRALKLLFPYYKKVYANKL